MDSGFSSSTNWNGLKMPVMLNSVINWSVSKWEGGGGGGDVGIGD